MNIKPIKTKADYKTALARVEKLMTAKPGTKAGDELDVLATLLDAYETEHFPIAAPNPIAAIQHRMEALGFERKDLEPFLGSRTRVYEVMTYRRKLTMDMVRVLHREMSIPASALIQDYEVRQ